MWTNRAQYAANAVANTAIMSRVVRIPASFTNIRSSPSYLQHQHTSSSLLSAHTSIRHFSQHPFQYSNPPAAQTQQGGQAPTSPPLWVSVDSAPNMSNGPPTRWQRIKIASHRWLAINATKLISWGLIIAGAAGIIYYFDPPGLKDALTPNFSSQNRFPATKPTTRLTDVMGCDEAKEEVADVIEYLKNPSKFDRLGGKMARGVLLLGPPGTGKTLLARAVAGEAGVPFFAATGADFEEKYVGVGAKRVRELFAEARKQKPAIVFIDEIDTIGGKRDDFDNPKSRMSLNQLLTELDGFEESKGVIVIAATNYAEKLDPALLRAGRFDRHITVNVPDIKGRRAILELYAKKIKLDPTVDLNLIARGTSGMTGADLYHLLNSASLYAATQNRPNVGTAELEYAKDKILMGAERKSAVNQQEIKQHVAVYESGKSLTALLTPDADPIHKVTLIQRGSQLGQTAQLRASDTDHVSNTYREYVAQIEILLGGRVAEELVYGADGITNTATADLQRATQVARQMVMAYGYGDRAGLVSHSKTDFTKSVSGSTKLEIDQEVQVLLNQAYERVKGKLSQNQPALDRITKALLQYEVLDGQQLKTIFSGGEISPSSSKAIADK